MQVPRDILLNLWTWLRVLTLLALGSLYQYTSSKQHQSAHAIVETATTAEAAHVLQSLQRRLSDISEAISGNGTADNESSFKAAAGVLLRANPFLQAITHVASVGVVSHVPSSPADPTLAQDRTTRDPLMVLSQGVVLSEPFAAETWLLAVLVAIGFAIGRRGPVTSGIWAGIGVGIVALGLTCFANLNTFDI